MRSEDLEPDAFGVHPIWVDAADEVHKVSTESLERIHAVIGEPPAELDARAPIVTRPGEDLGMGPVQITLESGETLASDGVLSSDFPWGYHWVAAPSGLRRRLIVSPGSCWLPAGGQKWGWAVQLYAVRSRSSWGIGDLGDLRSIREWAQRSGAEFLMVNPLHAVAPTFPQEASPYLPATRRFRNPIYLRVDSRPAKAGELNDADLVQRDDIWRLKDEALRTSYASASAPEEFQEWRLNRGQDLELYAVWCALARQHGPSWRDWPQELRDPASPSVTAFARTHQEEVGYQAWLQWLMERQLVDAAGSMTLIQDLPIGVSGIGFDAWTWQHLLAEGVTVGAPPDLLNGFGQDWGSPPFVPWKLREDNYEAFVQTIRATMAATGGLRIDHVMGLFRLWWVPEGGSPADGAYVRYPSRDLLDIVALESHRARALVVGEDLGTVEDGVREELAERHILSTRLVWFEDDDPADWPELSMSAVTTHDLPTVVGLWTGADAREQQVYTEITAAQAEAGETELRGRLMKGDVSASATEEEAVVGAYRRLAEAPSLLLCASLDDAVGAVRRPNLPGTTNRPNWSLRLPVDVEELPEHPLVEQVIQSLATHQAAT